MSNSNNIAKRNKILYERLNTLNIRLRNGIKHYIEFPSPSLKENLEKEISITLGRELVNLYVYLACLDKEEREKVIIGGKPGIVFMKSIGIRLKDMFAKNVSEQSLLESIALINDTSVPFSQEYILLCKILEIEPKETDENGKTEFDLYNYNYESFGMAVDRSLKPYTCYGNVVFRRIYSGLIPELTNKSEKEELIGCPQSTKMSEIYEKIIGEAMRQLKYFIEKRKQELIGHQR